MSYYIYGLRIRGDTECRYIGMTGFKPERRFSELMSAARERAKWNPRRLHPDGLYSWLLANKDSVEPFKIGKVETDIEARAMEKAIIALVLQLDHRLLNVTHVPKESRIGHIPTRWSETRPKARAA